MNNMNLMHVRPVRHLAAGLLMLVMSAAPGLSAAGLAQGLAAYDKADYATAHWELMPLAEKGNAQAQYRIGKMLNLGQGVPQSKSEAARWFHLAAEQGLAQAQAALGYLCLVGEGVSQNSDMAIEWTRKAAQQGDANAQFNLSVMHGDRYGIRKDPVESLTWLRRAAEQGHGQALDVLGHLYEQGGNTISRNPVKAFFLISAAAVQGDPAATAWVKSQGDRMAANDLQKARELLKKWKSGTPLGKLL